MTYQPGSPGNSGYPPGSYGAPSPSYAADGPVQSRLPRYLNIAVVVLGIAAYVASFGPLLFVNLGNLTIAATGGGPNNSSILLTLGSVLAALLAAIGLLPKTKSYPTVIAVLSVLGVLAVIEQMVNRPQLLLPTGPVSTSIAWGLWLVLAFVVLQAIVAVLLLLFDTGVLKMPAPKKPLYEPAPYAQYGQYGAPGGYYNQPGQPVPPLGGPQPGLRPSYPSRYSGGYQPGQSTGGFGSFGWQGGTQQGPPTPPTGYPSFSPPPAVGSGQHRATNPNIGQAYPSPQSPDSSSGSSSSDSSSSDSSSS